MTIPKSALSADPTKLALPITVSGTVGGHKLVATSTVREPVTNGDLIARITYKVS